MFKVKITDEDGETVYEDDKVTVELDEDAKLEAVEALEAAIKALKAE